MSDDEDFDTAPAAHLALAVFPEKPDKLTKAQLPGSVGEPTGKKVDVLRAALSKANGRVVEATKHAMTNNRIAISAIGAGQKGFKDREKLLATNAKKLDKSKAEVEKLKDTNNKLASRVAQLRVKVEHVEQLEKRNASDRKRDEEELKASKKRAERLEKQLEDERKKTGKGGDALALAREKSAISMGVWHEKQAAKEESDKRKERGKKEKKRNMVDDMTGGHGRRRRERDHSYYSSDEVRCYCVLYISFAIPCWAG